MDKGTHLSEAKETYVREGHRGLVLINGGAAIALLAFLQAVWAEPDATELARSILCGISFLVAGVMFGGVIFFARHRAFVAGHSKWPKPYYVVAYFVLPGLSMACFVLGMAITIYGGFQAVTAIHGTH